MFSLHFAFKNKTKKITVPKNLNTNDLGTLIAHSFKIAEKIIGLTNSKGQFISLDQLQKSTSHYERDILYLVTTQDMNEDNMSFASDNHEKQRKPFAKQKISQIQTPHIPQKLQGFYQGVIGDLQLFQQLLLQQNQATVVFCFVKQKPKNIHFPYYLYHTSKNSAIVYVGQNRICEFFIQNMTQVPKQIQMFIRSIIQVQPQNIQRRKQLSEEPELKQLNQEIPLEQQKQSPLQQRQQEPQVPLQQSQQSQKQDEELNKQQEMRSSLLQNLLKLRDDEEITQLEFYKMKSELLESMSDFMRKYQMGTRKGFRRHKNNNSQNIMQNNRRKQAKISQQLQRQRFAQRQRQRQQQRTPQSKSQMRPTYSRQQRRVKKYQIPIIVRKYNNVIQKISTSYPLSQEQQQSINLILELELKGLISEKQSGIYKSSILQQDPDIFPLFLDYFDDVIDQMQLVSKLKKVKKVNSQKKERGQHNMRLLIKYAKQSNYQILRNLLLQKNPNVISSLQKFRTDKNSQLLAERLDKIAQFQRQKIVLQDILN